jgi:pimeloyl-ACP methyl ester carboxylesterase
MTLETKVSPPVAAAGDSAATRRAGNKKPALAVIVGGVFGFASAVAPGATASMVRRMLFTPSRAKPQEAARAILARSRAEDVTIGDFQVRHYRWGESGPLVLLVHGWGGEAGQMAFFVDPLLERGYQVVAIDLPAHGKSSGRSASVKHFEPIIAHAGKAYGPFHGAIAHSLGAAAVTYAISRGFGCERVVFFGPVSRFASVWEYSRRMMNLPQKVMDMVVARAEKWLETRFDAMEPALLAPALSAQLMVVHDRGDRESPFSDGETLVAQWPRATLLATEKLGHTRALRDPEIVRQVVAFVTAPASNT